MFEWIQTLDCSTTVISIVFGRVQPTKLLLGVSMGLLVSRQVKWVKSQVADVAS